jgi:hypothetical protein
MTESGALFGIVRDNQGMALPGVTMTLDLQGPTQVEVTDDKGLFHFRSLFPGFYEIKAELEGFTPFIKLVEIHLARKTGLEITLQPALSE